MSESLEDFYKNLLEIDDPWEVSSIKRDSKSKEVIAVINIQNGEPIHCPVCGKEVKPYDHRTRRWRHLDSCNHKTLIEGIIPRVNCSEHGVKQIPVPWAEKNSRFTIEFECTVLLWLKDDPISTVAENFGVSWNALGQLNFTGDDSGWIKLDFASDGTPYAVTEDYSGLHVFVYSSGSDSWSQIGGDIGHTELEYIFDIAVDDTGTPWVAFSDFEESVVENEITVKQYVSGTGWVTKGVRGFSNTGNSVSFVDIEFNGGTAYVAANGHSGAGNDIVVYDFDGSSWSRYDDGSAAVSVSTTIYDFDFEFNGTVPYIAYACNDTQLKVGLVSADAGKVWSEAAGTQPSTGTAAYGVSLSFSGATPIVGFQNGLQEEGAITAYALSGGSWNKLGDDAYSSTDADAYNSRNVSSVFSGGSLYIGWVNNIENRGYVRRYAGIIP